MHKIRQTISLYVNSFIAFCQHFLKILIFLCGEISFALYRVLGREMYDKIFGGVLRLYQGFERALDKYNDRRYSSDNLIAIIDSARKFVIDCIYGYSEKTSSESDELSDSLPQIFRISDLDEYLHTHKLNRQTLTDFTVPDGIRRINYEAFADCTQLRSIRFPKSLLEIEGRAFAGCTSLTSITLPYSVYKIDACAFLGCTSLKSVDISSTCVISIYSNVFRVCNSLTTVSLPYGAAAIRDIQDYIMGHEQYNIQYIFFCKADMYLCSLNCTTYHSYIMNHHKETLDSTGLTFDNDDSFLGHFIYRMIYNNHYIPNWALIVEVLGSYTVAQVRLLLTSLNKSTEMFPSICIKGVYIKALEDHLYTFEYASLCNGSKSINLLPKDTNKESWSTRGISAISDTKSNSLHLTQ